AAESVHDHEARAPVAPPFVPGDAGEQPDVVAALHHEVLRGAVPAQMAARPEPEQRLAVAATGEGGGRERREAHATCSTILPKCCEASISSWARRASDRGTTSCTTG